jgi:FAD binding domain
MTTRRDFVKSAGAAMVGAVGFPVTAFTHTQPADKPRTANVGAPPPGGGETALATNGYLSAILPIADQAALREINVRLTQLAIDQCAAGGGARNQVEFGTLICLALADFATHDVFPDDLLRLSRDFDVVFPWSIAYGNARTPFNFRLVRLPLAIAFPRTVNDVVFWVTFVRDHGLSVSIRSGNNSYEGLSSTGEVVIDLTFLKLKLQGSPDAQFHIDANAGVVHVSPGVRLGVLYTELFERGFALAGGQCAPVCVGGLVGTGGVGFVTREFGFACDQLTEVQCVLADGSVVVANASNQYADLYRACKGAGAAGLGVMTRLTMKIVPAVTVLFYVVVFDAADGAPVLAAWQNLAATAPEALSSIAALTASTNGTSVLAFNGEFRVENGNVPAARAALTNVLQTQWLDLLPPPLNQTPIEILELTTLEAANAVALLAPMPVFNQWKLKSRFTFHSLTAADFQPVIDYLQNHVPAGDPTQGAGFLNLLLMGGASNRIDPNSSVVPAREGTVLWFHAGALWNDDSVQAQGLAFVDGLWAVLNPVLQSSTAQYGVPDLQLGSQLTTPPNLGYVNAFWSSPAHNFVPFLLGVKQKYDPADVFKGAQTIPLAL